MGLAPSFFRHASTVRRALSNRISSYTWDAVCTISEELRLVFSSYWNTLRSSPGLGVAVAAVVDIGERLCRSRPSSFRGPFDQWCWKEWLNFLDLGLGSPKSIRSFKRERRNTVGLGRSLWFSGY